MSKPCVCQGSNENCRYCFGKGFVPDTQGLPIGLDAAPRIDYPARRAASRGLKRARPFVACPRCGVDVIHLEKHLAKCGLLDSANRSVRAPAANTSRKPEVPSKSIFAGLKSGLLRALSLLPTSAQQSNSEQPSASRAQLEAGRDSAERQDEDETDFAKVSALRSSIF